MARPDRRSLTQRARVAELGETTRFNVVAPTNVAVRSDAANAAIALQRALGLSADIAEDQRAQREERDFNQGVIDAQMGNVDDAKRIRNNAYAAAAEQVEARALTDDDEKELDALLQEDIANGDVDTVRAKLREEFNKRWQGLSEVQANVVVPWMAGYEEKVTTLARQQAAKITQDANYANLKKAAEQEYRQAKFEGRAFDHSTIERNAYQLFGKDTNGVLTDIYSRIIEDNNDAGFRDTIPDAWETGRPSIKVTPGYRDKLDAATDKALLQNQRDAAAARGLQTYEALVKYDAKINAREWIRKEELDELVKAQVFTPAVAAQYLDRQEQIRQADLEKKAKEDAAAQLYGSLADNFKTGTWHVYAGLIPQEDIEDAYDQYIRDGIKLNPENALGFIASASKMNGLVYRPLESQLSKFNVQDAESFRSNVEQFRQLYSLSPTLARRYVKDNTAFDTYVSALTLQDYGRDARQVLSNVNQTDFETRQSQWMKGSVRDTALQKIDSIEFDTRDSWFDQEVGDLKNKSWVVGEFRRLIDSLGSTGAYSTAEEVVDAAKAVFEGRYVVIDNVAVPNDGSVPENIGSLWEWFHDDYVQKELDAAGIKLDASEVELRPDLRTARDRVTFGLYFRDSYEPVPGFADKRFTLQGIQSAYAKSAIAAANAARPAVESVRERARQMDWTYTPY